jgi:formylglycine-generating enzyme required for sulfatase activity
VDALLAADPRAIPAILANLAEHPGDVLPRLLEVWNEPDTPGTRPRRMRAALALLGSEPNLVRDALGEWMLEVPDPAELIVIRNALQPYIAHRRGELWRQLESPNLNPTRQLRLLPVLAALDPRAAKWNMVDERALEPWLADNPIYLGTWTEALRSARDALLRPLTGVFSGKPLKEHRVVAASILADYARDRPQTLVDLIVQADDRQFSILLPALEQLGPRVLPLLRRKVEEQPRAEWNDRSASEWPAPAANLSQQVEQAGGLLAERFALVQELALEQFALLAEDLRRGGYRPVRFRPYRVGQSVRVAAVWTRDGGDWRLATGLTVQELSTRNRQHQQQGFQAVDVAGYLVPGNPTPVDRYSALWVRSMAPPGSVHLVLGVEAEEYLRLHWPQLDRSRSTPQTCQVFRGPDGTLRKNEVWVRQPARWAFWAPMDEKTYEEKLTPDFVQQDVTLCSGGKEMAGVWHEAAGKESLELHGLTVAAHREHCRELAALGYRPVAISVAESMPGQPCRAASVWQRPRVGEATREALARQQAGAGLTLLRLGKAEHVWPLLSHNPHPEARSRLIQRLASNGVPAATLVARLAVEKDVSIRQALILALADYSAEQVPIELRQRLLPRLLAWYRQDPDAGLQGSIDFLLRHGKEGPIDRPLDLGQAKALEAIDRELAGKPPRRMKGETTWYVNREGQTLTVVDSQEPFLMGSPADETGHRITEKLHWRQIGRRYALGTKPVTVVQFERFLKAHPEVKHDYIRMYSPHPDGPIISVTWYEAVQYCRWLSEQKGIREHEMGYPSVAEIEKCKNGSTPLHLPPDHLKRRGYRLPTEAEWEYACRAGTTSRWYFGSSLELLPCHAWYVNSTPERTQPVGQKRPNDWGLFDMHGNVWQWCQESARPYPGGNRYRPLKDEEDKREVDDRLIRIVRGSTFSGRPSLSRTACRQYPRPGERLDGVGFRVARTCD